MVLTGYFDYHQIDQWPQQERFLPHFPTDEHIYTPATQRKTIFHDTGNEAPKGA